MKLMRSLAISIFLYACESWTLTAELEKRTQAFEMRCYRRLLNSSYKDQVTNEEVRRGSKQPLENMTNQTPDPGQEAKAKMVLKVIWSSKDNPTGHSGRKKKKRQTEDEVGRQYQRVDRNRLCQLN